MSDPRPSLRDFERPSLAVDLVLLTVADGALSVLVIRREDPPAEGDWSLPGGFVPIDESIDHTVQRVLRDKARSPDAFVEQLYTFGAVDRDPRGRVISVAYYGLVAHERLDAALAHSTNLALAQVITPWTGVEGGASTVRLPSGETRSLAFDHGEVLGAAVQPKKEKFVVK